MDWGLAEWMHSHQGQTCTERLTCTYFLDQRSPPPAGLKSWSPAYSPPGWGEVQGTAAGRQTGGAGTASLTPAPTCQDGGHAATGAF